MKREWINDKKRTDKNGDGSAKREDKARGGVEDEEDDELMEWKL